MVGSSSTSSSSVFRAVFVRLLLLAALLWAADRGVGALLAHFHAQTVEGDFGGCINLALKQRNDIVIFGSSRANHHYIPEVIHQETGMSVFNAGFDAQMIVFQYGLEQLILDAYTPKVVVLEMPTENLVASGARSSLDRLSVLLPYYGNGNQALRELLLRRSRFESLKLLSKIYPYNSQLLAIAKYTVFPQSRGDSRTNGYEPLYGSDLKRLVELKEKGKRNRTADPMANPMDPFYLNILAEFVQSARQRGVQVVVSYSPLWLKDGEDYEGQADVVEYYRGKVHEMDLPLIEVSEETHPEFFQPEYFKNRGHLNHQGAQVFSKIFARELRDILSHQTRPSEQAHAFDGVQQGALF